MLTSNNIDYIPEKSLHYRGIIKNDIKSLVSFNFYKDEINAIISDSKNSNLVIGKLKEKNNINDYINYSDKNLKILDNYTCNTKDSEATKNTPTLESTNSLKCVTLYFEIGYSIYNANNSSLTQTNNWMTSVFNNVQTIFNNDGITTALKSVFIWTTPDPYVGVTSNENLELFKTNRPIFNADLGQLLVIIGGQGGLAQGINKVCSSENYSFSDLYFDYQTVPTFSWTVNVICHELGHSMGSEHTHGCYWNGNNTAIDGCGPTLGSAFTEGTCPIGPIPTFEVKGTMMSYCYLINTVGINFANGFGPQPAARIIQRINNKTCLSTDCINTCISLISNLKAQNISNTNVILSWLDANLVTTQWEYAITTFPFTAQNWVTVSTNTVAITSLSPNTYYTFYVRPKCGTGTLGASRKVVFGTSDNFCSGRIFTDSGGNNGQYSVSENWTRVMLPDNPSNKIKVVFNNFDLENGYDYLYIYNGNTENSPLLTTGGLTGNITPTSYQSTAANGALTFKFVSDAYVAANGWNANISCNSLGLENNNYIDFSYYPNPITDVLTLNSNNEIQKISIYSIDGKLLESINNFINKNSINMSSYANGVYILKATIMEKTFTFKIAKE